MYGLSLIHRHLPEGQKPRVHGALPGNEGKILGFGSPKLPLKGALKEALEGTLTGNPEKFL